MSTGQVRKLVPRPSWIRIFEKYETDQEERFEKEVIGNTPQLGKALEGHKELKAYLENAKHKKPENLGTLHKLLTDKLIDVFEKNKKAEQRTVIANSAARNNLVELLVLWYKFVQNHFDIESMMCSFVKELLGLEDTPSTEPHLKDGYYVLLTIREILWNFSDSSHNFSVRLSEAGFFEILVRDLKDIYEVEFEDVQDEESRKNIFPFSSAVGILHNCARIPDVDKDRFREIDIINVLTPFMAAESLYVKMVTLLALCNMVTEEEVSKLATDNDVISFLTKAIKEAIKSEERMEHGFHLEELIDGLAAMAQSNDNKIIMMKKNAIALVTKILHDSKASSSEVLACVKLVWELSFLEEVKNVIKENGELIRKLRDLQKSSIRDIQDAASKAVFLLVDKDNRIKDGPDGTDKHVMISYCWGDKQKVLQIYNDLKKSGYSIWIDIEQMNKYMNLLEGMASAVEGASVVLICYSEKYKNSQNCRTEADYVYAKQKKFIPLKMQEKYTPDGWLGALIGAKLYIEFSGKYDYQVKYQELDTTLSREATSKDPANSKSDQSHDRKVSRVKEWTKEEVANWISQKNLNGSSFRKVKQLTGATIAFFIRVLNESPDTYFRWLESKLDLKTLDDLMKFDEALRSIAY